MGHKIQGVSEMEHTPNADKEHRLIALEKENEVLKKEVHALRKEVQEYYNFAKSLAKTIESKDGYLRSRLDLMVLQALELGRAIELPESDLLILKKAVLFRDLGKIKVPDSILNKPGKLTEEESKIMKQHPQFSVEILAELKGEPIDKLIEGIEGHHERVDGKGYPHGKTGRELSPIAKITAIMDFWNAIVSDRPYRKPIPLPEALNLVKVVAGSHLDADLVRIFIEKKIYAFSETSPDSITSSG